MNHSIVHKSKLQTMKRRKKIQIIRRRLAFCIATFALICTIAIIGFSSTTNASDKEHSIGTKCYTSVMIESGDTLWDIASTHKDPQYDSVYDYMRDIQKINNMGFESHIQSGDYLILPYYSTSM